MINYLNNELEVTTEDWRWKIKLTSPITCISDRDCGKTFLTEVIKSQNSSEVIVADEDVILSGFKKVTQNKLIVIDNCVMLQLKLSEQIFDMFINECLWQKNKLLLFNCDGVGIYIAESRIITLDINSDERITTGG